jgi:2-hydroxychromene-2-carboxylate isomerase
MAGSSTAEAVFYFDLASPLAYLAAERVLQELPHPAKWRPVLARELPGAESLQGWRCERKWEVLRGEVERRAGALELQPLRWPVELPFDSEVAMLGATYADSIGRVVAFAQAAFRQAFAGGRSLAALDNVLIAGAACEMHPTALAKGIELASVREALAGATAAARGLGVGDVPAIAVGDRVFAGVDAVEEAAAQMRASIAGAR